MASGTIENEYIRKLLLSSPDKAIRLLYLHYHATLLKIAVKRTHNSRVAEDIVQETMLHVWKNHESLAKKNEKHIGLYLICVVKNNAISYYRTHSKYKEEPISRNGHRFISQELSIEALMIKEETRAQIRQLITHFPEKEKQCLLLKIDEGLSPAQIAERLNVTQKAVERSITSANKRFRKNWKWD